MGLLDEWQIERGGDVCARCGEELAPGRPFYSALSERDGDFVRSDFCAACWEADLPADAWCFWRGRRAVRDQPRRVDTELLMDFFRRLAGADTDTKRALRFVLALYLMRRKAVKLVRTRRERDRQLLVLRRGRSQETFEVEDAELTEEQVQDSAGRLGELFGGRL